MPEPASLTAALPHGLPPWLAAFVAEAEQETRILAENGALQAAMARKALLQRLLSAAQTHLDSEITVEEAADLLGKHPESVRRAIRSGTLPDTRTKPRSRMRIRRGDLNLLAAPRNRQYDPVADAHDIAQRRSS